VGIRGKKQNIPVRQFLEGGLDVLAIEGKNGTMIDVQHDEVVLNVSPMPLFISWHKRITRSITNPMVVSVTPVFTKFLYLTWMGWGQVRRVDMAT
jgi:hypothetical protein